MGRAPARDTAPRRPNYSCPATGPAARAGTPPIGPAGRAKFSWPRGFLRERTRVPEAGRSNPKHDGEVEMTTGLPHDLIHSSDPRDASATIPLASAAVECVYVFSPQGVCQWSNVAEPSGAEVLGSTIRELFPDGSLTGDEVLRHVVETGRGAAFISLLQPLAKPLERPQVSPCVCRRSPMPQDA